MNALCATLVETNMSGDEQEAKMSLESRKLLQACNYKINILVGTGEVWTTSMVLLNMGAILGLASKECIMTARTPLIRTVKAIRLRSASHSLMEAREFVSLYQQIRQLHEKVGFLVVLGLATNKFLGTAFVCWYLKNISSKAGIISSVNSNPIVTAEATREVPAMAVKNAEYWDPVRAPCVTPRAVWLLSMSETFAQVKTSGAWTHQVETHDNLAGMYQVLLTHGVVDKAPEILYNVDFTSPSKPITQLFMDMKVARCTSEPSMWLVLFAVGDDVDNTVAVQVYKAQQSKQAIPCKHYDTTQQNASLREKRLTEIVQFSEEYDDYKLPFLKMVKHYESMWNAPLTRNTSTKHRIFSNPPDAALIYSALYRAGIKQREQKCEKVNKMREELAWQNLQYCTEHRPSYVYQWKTDVFVFVLTIVALAPLQNRITIPSWDCMSASTRWARSKNFQLSMPVQNTGESRWTIRKFPRQSLWRIVGLSRTHAKFLDWRTPQSRFSVQWMSSSRR